LEIKEYEAPELNIDILGTIYHLLNLSLFRVREAIIANEIF